MLKRSYTKWVPTRMIRLLNTLGWLNRLNARERWTRWLLLGYSLCHREEWWALNIPLFNTMRKTHQTTKTIRLLNLRANFTAPCLHQDRALLVFHQQMRTWILSKIIICTRGASTVKKLIIPEKGTPIVQQTPLPESPCERENRFWERPIKFKNIIKT